MAEETTLRLQQVICPSCRRPINTFNPNKLMAECPYCRSKLVNPLVNPKDIPMPERFIPFSTNEKDFEKALVDVLVNTDYVPATIFGTISFGDVIQTYIPMDVFEGNYNASWACQSGVEIEGEKDDDKPKISWIPQSGMATGNFSFLMLANESEDIPEELQKFAYSAPYDINKSKSFQPEAIDYENENLMILECSTDVTLVWENHGKKKVDAQTKRKVENQMWGMKTRRFRITSNSYNLTSPMGKYILVPFWFVYYNFGGKQYYFLMDGNGDRTSFTYPQNKEEMKFVRDKKKEKKGCLFSILAALYGCLPGYFAYIAISAKGRDVLGAIVGIVIFFIIRACAKNYMNNKIDNEIKERLAKSKARRQDDAAQL